MRYIKGEIDTTKGGFSPEILEYIIRTIKEEDIGSYTKNYKKSDSKLYDKVKNEMNNKSQRIRKKFYGFYLQEWNV